MRNCVRLFFGLMSLATIRAESGGPSSLDPSHKRALNKGGDAAVNSLSCVSAGKCAATGYYVDGSWKQQAFVASQIRLPVSASRLL